MNRRPASWRRRIFAVWLGTLVVSHVVATLRRGPAPLDPADLAIELPVFAHGEEAGASARVVYRDTDPNDASKPALLLLHGSPGSLYDFVRITPALARTQRVIAPDLPGFGKSRGAWPDYSIDAHARSMIALLDRLAVERVHVVGFSMGGAVAIRMTDLAPERIASTTLLSATGVQEFELFGSYELNHLVHAFQIGVMNVVRWFVPHFGTFDRAFLGYGYARNFLDTDQRPMRPALERYDGPMLVLHGQDDFLVPVEAALEHHRLVPQSTLTLFEDEGHFLLFQREDEVAAALTELVATTEAGRSATRAQLPSDALEAARLPFDPTAAPPLSGMALWVLMALVVCASYVSEDLACIGVGLLIADGRLGFVPGTLACLVGIFTGDIGVYGAGRLLGRPAIDRIPLRWLITPIAVERANRFFRKHGGKTILISRLLPGARLATYFVAGVSRAPFGRFLFFFLIGGLVWTPLLVAGSMWIGREFRSSFEAFEEHSLVALVLVAVSLLLLHRVIVPSFTARGRRQLLGVWKRWTDWEFWPAWMLYAPVALHVLRLALRHRSLSVVTATNPGIPAGGFVGESKCEILDALAGSPEHVARYVSLPVDEDAESRTRRAHAFVEHHGLDYPVVLKPDVGQRGSGVFVVDDPAELDRRLAGQRVDCMLQEFVPGVEFGVFYARRPSEPRGRVISITEKIRPHVVGDGERTLEDLILFDDRAVAMAPTYFDLNLDHLDDVPARGAEVTIARIGTHCRGAVFLDGARVHTPDLEVAIDRVSQGFEGFFFGRYDLRAPSEEALASGRAFKIVELNGLTSEAAHIYDPRHDLRAARRTLRDQWTLAFDIAQENVERGAKPARLRELVRRLFEYSELQRHHATR